MPLQVYSKLRNKLLLLFYDKYTCHNNRGHEYDQIINHEMDQSTPSGFLFNL